MLRNTLESFRGPIRNGIPMRIRIRLIVDGYMHWRFLFKKHYI